MVLGGATRRLLTHMIVPVLMSHWPSGSTWAAAAA